MSHPAPSWLDHATKTSPALDGAPGKKGPREVRLSRQNPDRLPKQQHRNPALPGLDK